MPVAGPPIQPFDVQPDRARTVGRSSQSDIQLPDQCISRQHASLECRDGLWHISDRASRLGTMLNSLKLEPDRPTPLREGDLLSLGPWTFRVQLAQGPITEVRPTASLTDDAAPVETVRAEQMAQLAKQRLALLMDFASSIQQVENDAALARIAALAAAEGTGHSRAAVVRPVRGVETVTVTACVIDGRETATPFTMSRSLLRAASTGQLARLGSDRALGEAFSIVSMGIHSALCAPIMNGAFPSAYIYVDHGEKDHESPADAAAFLSAVAHLTALAGANLERRNLEHRQRQLEADLNAARQAQARLMPPARGRVGCLAYAMASLPGRLVAGDLFDVVELDQRRVAFFLGDVSGKGVGAAVLMAAAQTLLRASLRAESNVAAAVSSVNRELVQRSASQEFISLLVGVVDPAAGIIRFVDAGHGYWISISPGTPPQRVPTEGGLVLGVDPDFVYTEETIPITPGSRVVTFSDGVIEQHGPASGAQFGFPGIQAALAASASEVDDVGKLVTALKDFAQSEHLSDDVTIASLRFDPA